MGYSELAKKFMPAHSNNYQKGRGGYKICKFTPHHMAGVLTAERCGELFQNPSRVASANYGIGNDGTIICYVDENDRAYTSSNKANDCQAITVEVSNCMTGGEWPISAAAWESLINLAVDVCKRYDFRLVYDGTPDGSLTYHQMFAATACPGPYLIGKMPELAEIVNARLDAEAQPEPAPEPVPEVPVEGYLVKVTANVLNIRADAGTEYKITGQITDHGVYTIVAEKDGTGASKWGKLKSGAGWISLDYVERQTSTPVKQEEPATPQIKKGSKVKLTGRMTYSGIRLAEWTYGNIFDVIEISGDRVVIGRGTAITAAVHIRDCQPI